MDIRNIERPPYKKGMDVLDTMFSLQLELLDEYIKIESLQPYPFSINKKKDQLQIKDFISRVVEELAEANESYRMMFQLMNENREADIMPFYENFLEEIADAWHFLLEVFVYCNIDAGSMQDFAASYIQEQGIKEFVPDNETPMQLFFAIARDYNYKEGHQGAKAMTIHFTLSDTPYKAGRQVSRNLLEWHSQMLWEITYHLNIARNFLKNKPWKQTEMVTDIPRFQECLMNAFMALMAYMDFIELYEEEIYVLYYKKNQVNKFRIKSKY